MAIVYALVSRQKTVLAEYTATSGEDSSMVISCLSCDTVLAKKENFES